MKNKDILYEMINIYGINKIDWMGWEITSTNKLTYHHIIEKRNGGEESVQNGALLTRKAHQALHQAEVYNPDLYNEYQYWFRIINDMMCPPTEEIMEIMRSLRARIYKKGKPKELFLNL